MYLVLFSYAFIAMFAGIRFTTWGTAASMMSGSLKVIYIVPIRPGRRKKKVSETVTGMRPYS